MSLRTFHLFFLAIAILFDFGFAAYAFWGPEEGAIRELRAMGIGSGVFGVILLIYGIWFLVKKRPQIAA